MANWKTWNDVPVGERNVMANMVDVWEQTIGFKIALTTKDWLAMANAGITSQHDIGHFASVQLGSRFDKLLATMPWAKYGLDKDSYAAMSTTFETTYKKITGSTMSEAALQKAFANPKDLSGGLLDASQYAQQLMNDTAIQKQFGWVKYGLDYTAWTQQKLTLQGTFGAAVKDSEAATILQYTKAASGSNMSAIAHQTGQQGQAPAGAGAGVGGSVAR